MPIYVYRCPGCSIEIETIRSFSKITDMIICPSCGVVSKNRPIIKNAHFFFEGGLPSYKDDLSNYYLDPEGESFEPENGDDFVPPTV